MAGYNLKIPAILLLLLPVLLSSCRNKDPMLDILEGNSRYVMGDYAGATVNYMQALPKQKYQPWIYYNLGNTYSALGEIEPAIIQYKKALEDETPAAWAGSERPAPELQFRVNFNLGNLYYELGEYGLAVSFYKAALRAESGSMDAKFNLELAEKKYSDNLAAAGEQNLPAASGRNRFLPAEMQDILESTRRKEESVWNKLREKQPSPRGEDW